MIKARFKAWRKRRVIKSIRRHMKASGYPLDQFSDLEIEKGIAKLADLLSGSGVTVKEASEAFGHLNLKRIEKSHPRAA